jgi:site-specific recombinase XerD
MRGIAPNEVTAETFDKYLDYLVEFSTVANPRERWHVARRGWNRDVVGADTIFPHIPNNEPDGWRGLPLSEFPESLRLGFEKWRAHMLHTDPFASVKATDVLKPAARRALREVTVGGYIASLRQSASRLIEKRDVPVTQFASLAALVDLDTVKEGLRLIWGDRDFDEARPGMHALMTATLNLAAYLNVKGDHLDELKLLAKRVRHRPKGMCERNKARLQPFKDKEVLRRLISLPLEVEKRLQKEVEKSLKEGKSPTARQAQVMQMAVLLELLLHVPMRVKNAASLDLAKHFQLPAGGKPGKWRLSIPKGEVKNDKAIDAELGAEISALFRRYVSVFLPVLSNGQTTALFVGQNGRKCPPALGKQFEKFIGRELGLTVNIHLMRHLMAFAYLEANPGDYEGARQLLGHKQIATTIHFYAGAESEAAFRRLDKVVDRLRDAVPSDEPIDLDLEDVL